MDDLLSSPDFPFAFEPSQYEYFEFGPQSGPDDPANVANDYFELPTPNRSLGGLSALSSSCLYSNEGTFVETFAWGSQDQQQSSSQPQFVSILPLKSSPRSSTYTAPPVPEFALSKSIFKMNDLPCVDQLLMQLNVILEQQTSYGLQFEANFEKCEFTCFYIVGSKHCKFVLSVYDNSPSRENSFLVEAQKRNGDSAPFRSIFDTIKVCCMTSPSLSVGVRESFSNSVPTPSQSNWDAESVEGLLPILNMAKSRMIDTQLEGARLICEISSDDACHECLLANGVVDITKDIIEDSMASEWAKQHAVLALVNLCDQVNCQEAIIKAGVLPVLLRLATDGPCQSAELRRLSVVILAKISSRVAAKVIQNVDAMELKRWMGAVDSLRDSKIKLQAEIVRSAFREVL